MILNIGTANKAKVQALKEIIKKYPLLKDAEVVPLEVDSLVAEQPKSLEETIQGSINRARKAFKNCDYSFGIESGLMRVPQAKSGYMDFCSCAIYDGKEKHLGLSSCFEYPKEVMRLILEEGITVTQAFNRAGLTDNKDIGSAEGGVGILTKKRLTRKTYTQQAIITALIHLENKELF